MRLSFTDLFNKNKKIFLLGFLLLSATLAVYAGILGNNFLNFWDDHEYVLFNESAKGFTLQHLKTAFTGFFVGNYAPMHIVSYMLDYSLWGMNPAGYFFGNILLHASSGLLLYSIMLRLRYPPMLAFVAAYIFLFHPVQVESVAWISQRKNVLAMFFFLIALQRYMIYREEPARRATNYLLSVSSLSLALLSKSVTVIFPVVALLYDLSFEKGDNRRVRIADKIPYVVVAAVIAFLALTSQAEQLGGGRRDYPGGSIVSMLYTMLPVLASYLKDVFLPIGLGPYYIIAIKTEPDMTFILSLALLLFLIILGIVLFFKNRRLCFFYCLFFIGLLPVFQIVPLITLKNDRYLYFPLLGLAGFCAEIISLLKHAFPQRQKPLILLVIVLLLPLPVLSFRQASIWKDDLTLWNYVVRKDPENLLGWLQLSRIYTLKRNDQAANEAAEHYELLVKKYGSLRGWENDK